MDEPVSGMFNTPPPVSEHRSWMREKSEQESYGIQEEKSNESAEDNREEHEQEEIDSLPEKLEREVNKFVHSLKEPKYVAPLVAEDISNLFQQFYVNFETRCDDYLRGSGGYFKYNHPRKERPLESFQEISEKRKERSLRPARIKRLVELAEVYACETVYDKIFELEFSKIDTSLNKFIQSRLNCLNKIPITLENLELPGFEDAELFELLKEAGQELQLMTQARNPKLKLDYLLSAHKVIVAVLTEHNNNSNKSKNDDNPNERADVMSADLILPALIFTFVSYQTPNLWLNLKFISRFRNQKYLHGEYFYCLTNFEASVAFLQSLTPDMLHLDLERMPKDLDITSLLIVSTSEFLTSPKKEEDATITSTTGTTTSSTTNNNATTMYRRLSLLHPTDIATTAVQSADQSIKSIGTTFGNSYKFIMGKFVQAEKSDQNSNDKYPNTLADARKVVGLDPSTPPPSLGRNKSDNSLTRLLSDGNESSSSLGSRLRSKSNETSTAIFGKFSSMGMIRNLRQTSDEHQQESTNSREVSPMRSRIPAPKNDRLTTCDTDSLKMSDIHELHAEYKRLVKHLKSINAFD